MLYVFFGTDVVAAREQARTRASALASLDTQPTYISASEYYAGVLTERANSVSLFGSDTVTVLDTLSDDADAFTTLIDDLAVLAEAEHTFVVLERPLLAAEKKVFQKYATECIECTSEKQERFNTFALTDALLERDKKSLWLLLTNAFAAGVSHEEVVGLLFWQVKTLRLVARTSSAEEAGLKPFVYSKAKRALSKFKPEEPDRFSRELLTLYHEGHLGTRDMGLALEQWVLSV